jgi:hypothetical protein
LKVRKRKRLHLLFACARVLAGEDADKDEEDDQHADGIQNEALDAVPELL